MVKLIVRFIILVFVNKEVSVWLSLRIFRMMKSIIIRKLEVMMFDKSLLMVWFWENWYINLLVYFFMNWDRKIEVISISMVKMMFGRLVINFFSYFFKVF